MSRATETVLQNHLRAAGAGVDAIMEDFGEKSVLITEDATFHGLKEIHHFFTTLFDSLPGEFIDAFTVTRQEVVDEVGYIVWQAKPWVEQATDTLAIGDGKIRFQTFTAFQASARVNTATTGQ